MRRFRWSLQRLLDVTLRREDAQKAQVQAIAGRIAAVYREIEAAEAMKAGILTALSRQGLMRRMAIHDVAVNSIARYEAEKRNLQETVEVLQREKQQAAEKLLEIRMYRQMLEKLRGKAHDEYLRQVRLEDQKLQDESAVMGFARSLADGRTG
ncbi:MAG: hypothetical protein ACLFVU_12845 [Phycisphaerae bacterium]